MENATPPTPKGRVSVAKITMIIKNQTKAVLLTPEQWADVRRFHITDRSKRHKPCLCQKCGLSILPEESRAEFYLRDEQLRLVAKGFVCLSRLRAA